MTRFSITIKAFVLSQFMNYSGFRLVEVLMKKYRPLRTNSKGKHMDHAVRRPETVGENGRKSIQAVEKGVRVLEALIHSAHPSSQLRDIAESAGMSRSQTHRYLLALINTGLAIHDVATGLYSLGPTALKVGLAALTHLDVIRNASAMLEEVVLLTGYTGFISVWGDRGPTVIRWLEGVAPFNSTLSLGSVLPLHGSSTGLIYLSFCVPGKTKDILAQERSRGEGSDPAHLAAMIKRTRVLGYATTGRVVPGFAAIVAPVFDYQGWPAATIGVLSRSNVRMFFAPQNINHVVSCAERAGAANGWQRALGPAIMRYAATAAMQQDGDTVNRPAPPPT